MRNKYSFLIFVAFAILGFSLAFAKVGNAQAADTNKDKDQGKAKQAVTAPVAPYYGRYFTAPYYGYGYGRSFAYPYYGYNRYYTYPYYGGYYAAPYYGYGWSGLYVTPWWYR